MNRRHATTTLLTALAGGSLTGLPVLLSGCRQQMPESEGLIFFTWEEMQLLEQVAETILPPTLQSPGAKAAGIGPFMDRYVADCLEESAQEILRKGLESLDRECREQYGEHFLKLTPEKQHDFLVALDIEADTQQQVRSEGGPHYFLLLKGLTLLGYFTSEAGATQALRYLPVPGKYEGSIPYEEGDKAWAI